MWRACLLWVVNYFVSLMIEKLRHKFYKKNKTEGLKQFMERYLNMVVAVVF